MITAYCYRQHHIIASLRGGRRHLHNVYRDGEEVTAAEREDAEQRVEPSLPLHLSFPLSFSSLFSFDLVSAHCGKRMEPLSLHRGL